MKLFLSKFLNEVIDIILPFIILLLKRTPRMLKKVKNLIGMAAFWIGILLAIIFAFTREEYTWPKWILVITGIIVGLLNITKDKIQPFLFSGTVLIIVTTLGDRILEILSLEIYLLLKYFLYIFVPATLIVVLKKLIILSKGSLK